MIDKIQADLKTAMLAHDSLAVSVLRSLLNALRNEAKTLRRELTAAEEQTVLRREAKQRNEAAVAFTKGGASQRAEQEQQERALIDTYLPQPLSDDELDVLVKQAVDELGNESKNMGQIISLVVERAAGRAEGGRVAAKVHGLLK